MKIKRNIFYLLLIMFSINTHAFSWQDLWKSKNQQAKAMMEKNEFEAAKYTFQDENWRAVAAFRAKDYQLAADIFAKSNTIDANYNLGNALAKLGKYSEAITAYNKVLAIDKNNKDAKYNKELIEKLLQQQKSENNTAHNPKQKPADNEKSQDKDKQKKDSAQQNKQPQDQKKQKTTQPKKFNRQNKQDTKNKDGSNNQMQEQWLKLIPDDPGGLLREKFKRDYLRRRGELNQ